LKPIEVTDPLAHSADLTAEKIDQLRQLFPEAVTEDASGRKVDFDVLRSLLGDAVTDGDEKYGLNWHGKRAARRLALTPSTGTLRPSPEDSVDWDTTQNLMIEGDNLEVLKLLQKSYAGKVKMIYIDPPYNTGNDFVYKDDFKDSIGNYHRLTGQRDEEGVKLTTNSESSGRFHTDWLNMIYPRLALARNLLKDDGVIFISIDDGEQAHIRAVCDEVFGPENFIASVIWHKKYAKQNDSLTLSVSHDYIVTYCRSASTWTPGELPRSAESLRAYKNPDGDPKGLWQSVVYTCAKTRAERPNLYYPIRNPVTGKEVLPEESRVWGFDEQRSRKNEAEGRLWWGINGELEKPRLKTYLSEVSAGIVPDTLWSRDEVGDTQDAAREIISIFGSPVFDTPKPTALLERCITVANVQSGDLILDFFAGSGTTGQASAKSSVLSEKSIRYILVQLDAPLNTSDITHRTATDFLDSIHKPHNIAELTKERLRRSSANLKSENPLFHGDFGFRVFKLDTTSIRPWEPTLAVTAETLPGLVENILPGRTEQDLLYELLLKRGLELTVPLETKEIAAKRVYAVGAGTLIACLAPSIAAADVEALSDGIIAWHKQLAPDPAPNPETPKAKPPKFESPLVVFRDSAFADDVAKSNLTEILKQHGLTDVRSL
jgi:adenine-specific DNA-methyltransferase